MSGLPNKLHRRCRNILLKCSEFDSNTSLRAVFVTKKLHPFCSGLPEAANKSERVDKCLEYLLDKRLSDGQPVLPLFLTALRDRYQAGDALRDELGTLVEAVQSALAPPDLPSTAVDSRQPTAPATYNTEAVRDMLTAAFDDEGLTALCYDHFRPVYDDFSVGMSKRHKIHRLLDYCERHLQMGKLLTLIEKHNPDQYARFKDLFH